MLDETLVIWGGEFGRTPMAQGNGRDHHMKGFSMFLCGGGIKPGIAHGATDELGYNAVEDVAHVRGYERSAIPPCTRHSDWGRPSCGGRTISCPQ